MYPCTRDPSNGVLVVAVLSECVKGDHGHGVYGVYGVYAVYPVYGVYGAKHPC